MSSTTSMARRYAAAVAGAGIISVIAASPALAASGGNGDVTVVNTETVQVYASADGTPDTKRVYEQLAMTGKGKVDLANPIATSGLRNLDGFGGYDVKDGNQIVRTTVDGEKKLRSVSDYKGELPLDVSVSYELDGKVVKPGDVVGKNGHLVVTFVVENVTGKPQTITVPDGQGGTLTKTAEVAIPMVGSLTTATPASFTNVDSKQANMAGDGKGGTKLSFTMTLFPPIGSTTATFGYEADVVDGVVPRVDISALPVNPLESPTFASAAKSYQGGADTGAKLADGAAQIDANLLKLRDGSAELLAGLIKLRDGAGDLSKGLNDDAVPGSAKLADGAGQLSDGLTKLDDGAGQLSAGSSKLADGTGTAYAGSKDLKAGAGKLSGGLDTLSSKTPDLASGSQQLTDGGAALVAGLKQLRAGVAALPATVKLQLEGDGTAAHPGDPQYLRLVGTLNAIVQGIGTDASTGLDTIMGGLFQVRGGLRTPYTYANNDCVVALGGGTPTKCGVADAAQFMASLLPAKKAALNCASLILKDLSGGAAVPEDCLAGTPLTSPLPNLVDPTTLLSTIGDQLGASVSDLDGLLNGLNKIKTGVDGQLIPGVNQLRKALYNPGCSPTQTDKTASDYCGVSQAVSLIAAGVPVLVQKLSESISEQLLAGIGASGTVCKPGAAAQLLPCAEALAAGQSQLNAGIGLLVSGVSQLQAGGVQLSDGAAALSTGLGQIDDGANQLSDGAGQLAAGAGDASDGGQQVADGAGQLSNGLKTAADGSDLLFGGLVKAADAAPALPDGAQRLSSEGTKKLVAAGKETAMSYGEMVSVMKAGAARADAEDMANGAPAEAIGLTAYSYVLKGEDGEGGRNVARALGGLAVFGAAGGLFFLRRRFLL